MYEGRYATREDIDAAMRFGCGYPMGPLALLDLIGLDTAYEILETMYRQGRDRLHAPAPILKQMVTAGMLGRKTGRGFYTYEARTARSSSPTTRRRRPTTSRSCSTTSSSSASSAPARWPPASSRSSPRRATTCSYVGRRQDKVDGVAATTSTPRQGDPARPLERGGQGATCSAGSPASTSLDDLGDVDIVVEAIAEDLAVKTDAVREPRRDLQAGRDPGHHDLVAAGHRVRPGHQPARRTSSACTSSTRRRS